MSEGNPATQNQADNVVNKDGLMELFDQFSGLVSPMLGWLELYTTIFIIEASLQKSTTYQVTIQNLVATAILDTGANISVVFGKVFWIIPSNISTIKICTHEVKLASRTTLDPIGQCDLTLRLVNKLVHG